MPVADRKSVVRCSSAACPLSLVPTWVSSGQKLLVYGLQVWAGLQNVLRSVLLRATFTVGLIGKTHSVGSVFFANNGQCADGRRWFGFFCLGC